MLEARHVPLVVRAVGSWLFRSRAGRRVGLGLLAVVAGAALLGRCAPGARRGSWEGFANFYAPDKGELSFDRGRCALSGRTGEASGDGWVFRGTATARETKCEVRVGSGGRVEGTLAVRLEWDGRVKGNGGDWEDTSGTRDCEGEISGTFAKGGTWDGRCTRPDGSTWATTLTWKAD